MTDIQLNIPIEMELRLIDIKNIFPLGIYMPLIERQKYQYLLVNKTIPVIIFIVIGEFTQNIYFNYDEYVSLESTNNIYSYGSTPTETINNYELITKNVTHLKQSFLEKDNDKYYTPLMEKF